MTDGQKKLEEHALRTIEENNANKTGQINAMMKSEYHSCSYENGELSFKFPVQEWQANRGGTLHGGMLCTAIDITIAALARFYSQTNYAPTISLEVKFIRPAQVGDKIIIKTQAIAAGRRISHLMAEVRSEETGKIIATATSIYMNVDTTKEH